LCRGLFLLTQTSGQVSQHEIIARKCDLFFLPLMSVVLVNILINLASAYLKPQLDSYLLRTSSRWRSRSAKRLATRNKEIEAVLSEPHQELLFIPLANKK